MSNITNNNRLNQQTRGKPTRYERTKIYFHRCKHRGIKPTGGINNLSRIIWTLVIISFIAGYFISEKKNKNRIINYCNDYNMVEISNDVFKNDSMHFVFTERIGYGGKISCLIKIQDSIINTLEIINHSETHSYFKKCDKFINSFTNKSINNSSTFPDVVSGATITSDAINQAVAIAYYKLNEKEIPNTKTSFVISKATPIIVAILLLSITSVYVKKRKLSSILNWFVLLLSLITIGFYLNKPLTLTLLSQFIIFQPPVLFSNIDIYLLLGSALFSILFFRKNLYCKHICPFGAFQECCTIAIKPNNKLKFGSLINKLPILLTGIALIPAFLFRAPGLAQYEIYSGIFDFKLSLWLYLMFITVIVMMFFINRPWCKLFCPTGAILNYLLKLRIKL